MLQFILLCGYYQRGAVAFCALSVVHKSDVAGLPLLAVLSMLIEQ